MNSHNRLIALAITLFIAAIFLGFAVVAGHFHNFDIAVSHTLNLQRGISPNWLIALMQVISWIGGGVQRYIMVTLLVFALWRWQGRVAALTMGAASLLSSFTSDAMKLYFARFRPDLVAQLDPISSPAYPSGHATNAAVVYLLLILLIPQARRPSWVIMAITLVLLTGISRIMLGVHWPTDVIGGWMLGTSFALLAAAVWRGRQ